jgi:glc operon protein GlcG
MTDMPPIAADAPTPYGSPISFADARAVADAAEAEARRRGWPVVIAVVDGGGHLAVLYRRDQSNLGSIEVAQGKALTAVRFRRPTRVFEQGVADGGSGLRFLNIPGMVPLEGGLPLLRNGHIVGAIGVSGMSSPQDAEIAAIGAAALPTAQ